MSQNRIYLRCKGCGRTLFLGKCFAGEWFYRNYTPDQALEDKLNEFYFKHQWCKREKETLVPYDEKLFPLEEGFEGCLGSYDIVYENGYGTGYGKEDEA